MGQVGGKASRGTRCGDCAKAAVRFASVCQRQLASRARADYCDRPLLSLKTRSQGVLSLLCVQQLFAITLQVQPPSQLRVMAPRRFLSASSDDVGYHNRTWAKP